MLPHIGPELPQDGQYGPLQCIIIAAACLMSRGIWRCSLHVMKRCSW